MNVPNHEKKQFREMTAEERSAIVEAWLDGNVEFFSNFSECWAISAAEGLFNTFSYRTKPRQLIIPWEVIKPEYKWAAMDADGELYMHKESPSECRDGWWSADEERVAPLNIDTTGIEWRESLVQRQDGV